MFNPSEIPWQKPQILNCGIDWNGWLFRIFQEDFAKTKMLLRTKVRIDILLLHSYIKISTFKDLFSTLTNILNIYWQIYWQILVFFVAKHKAKASFANIKFHFQKWLSVMEKWTTSLLEQTLALVAVHLPVFSK